MSTPPMRRLTLKIYEIEHAGDLQASYEALKRTGIQFFIQTERIRPEGEYAVVELDVREKDANWFISQVRHGEDGELYVFGTNP